MRACLESRDHAPHRLVEEHSHDLLQHLRAELEIDIEVDERTAVGLRQKDPMIVEVLERAFTVGDIDAVGSAQHHARSEALAHHLVADQKIAEDFVALLLADARADAPGQEFGIALDIGNEIEELLSRVRQQLLFGMRRHQAGAAAAASAAFRAARSLAKSSPAKYEDRVSGEAETMRKPLPKAWRFIESNSAGGTKRSTA